MPGDRARVELAAPARIHAARSEAGRATPDLAPKRPGAGRGRTARHAADAGRRHDRRCAAPARRRASQPGRSSALGAAGGAGVPVHGSDRGGSVRLRLSPPELGSLRIEITVRHGEMTARLETETTAAQNLLLDNLPALRDRLAQQDIKIQQFDVDLMDRSFGGSPDQTAQYTESPEPATAAEPAAAAPAAANGGSGRGTDGLRPRRRGRAKADA